MTTIFTSSVQWRKVNYTLLICNLMVDSVRSRILYELQKAEEGVSGTVIAERLGISRAAVWKHIQALKNEGYEIEGTAGSGYILKNRDIISTLALESALEGTIFDNFIYYPETISTNILAMQLGAKGAKEGTVVIADRQTGGRGRLGRSWHSPPGGLWFSLILRPDIPPSEAPLLSLVGGISVMRTLRSMGLEAGLKWPNDVLINGKKVCGILGEVRAEMDMVDYIVLGIGLNVNLDAGDFDAELKTSATSLKIETGIVHLRQPILISFLRNFNDLYSEFLSNGFEALMEEYMSGFFLKGRWARISAPSGMIEGRVTGITSDGGLLLEAGSSSSKVLVGTVVSWD